MNKILLGVAGVAAVLAIAAGIAWAAGWDGPDRDREHTVTYTVVDDDGVPIEDGSRVLLVERDGFDGPPFPFFPIFPLLVVGGVVLTIALVRRGGGPRGPGGRFDEWHRRAHADDAGASNG